MINEPLRSNFQFRSICEKLKDPSDPLSKYLNSQFSPATRSRLLAHAPRGNEELALGQALLNDLNRIIRSGPLYDPSRFGGIKLSPEASNLLRLNPQGDDLVRLNIALLLDAYPVGLWRERELDEQKPLLEKATRSPERTPPPHIAD